MRICEFCKNLGIGGIEAQVCGLSNALAKEQEVTVCTILAPYEMDVFYRRLSDSVKKESIGANLKSKPLATVFKIARYINRRKFDVVHIHGFFYYYALAILLFHRKNCFCYTVHSDALKENNPWDLRLLFFKRFCFKRGWLHPITISETSKASFSELYHCDSRLIPNGVVRPVPPAPTLLAEYKVTPLTKVLIHASRISPEKNQLILCKVFDRIVKEGHDVVLLIAGPVHYKAIFEMMEQYFSDRIRYIGNRPDIPAMLCLADGMCLSSLYEGLPVILLEALAAGCIPVCTAVGGIQDVIVDGKNGFLAPSDSEDAYLDAVMRLVLLADSDRERIKQACLSTGREYDMEKTKEKYLAYFEELMGRC